MLKWRDGRTLAVLFAVTIVLPALTLAVLAFRALESDRRLADQAWHDKLQDAARLTDLRVEERIQDLRLRAIALSQGQPQSAPASAGILWVVLSPSLEVNPSAPIAWIPDGHAAAVAPLPGELEKAEAVELRTSDPLAAETTYSALLPRTPALWHGWLYLRLSRSYAKLDRNDQRLAALMQAARLPDSPGSPPTSLAASLELVANSPQAAASLYADLSRGRWLPEKSLYAFYEDKLRRIAGPALPQSALAAERRRHSLSQILEQAVGGATGWLTAGDAAALVIASSGTRKAAVLITGEAIRSWLPPIAAASPRDVGSTSPSSRPATPA